MSQQKTPASAKPRRDRSATQDATGERDAAGEGQQGASGGVKADHRRHNKSSNKGSDVIPTPPPVDMRPKISVPSRRQPLPQDLEDELNAALGGSDLDKILVGDPMLQVGHQLTEGQRLQGRVMKVHGENVFVSLGGPNEGVIPSLQFSEVPAEGTLIEVIVRGYLVDEGLYELTAPGNAIEVSDWSDLKEGDVVEALVTGANTGGLECKVGSVRGFIPASQVSEYRVENLTEMVDQKVLCVITEANERRGNLVLSRRAVLEREKQEKREERLANLNVGDAVEGIVRKILDFGAFVDIGGLDGLIHVSQLSWERVNHPREVLEEGQKVHVRVEKIDEQTGKIGLSYRALQDDPWSNIEDRFPVGTVVHGSVTRIAEFGAFVRIATGVEGLIHISELAHHRVHNVSNVVQEGQEIDTKILSIEPEKQRIGLSLKAAQAAPEPVANQSEDESATEEAPAEPILPKHRGPLKGGTTRPSSGEQFGLKW
jgi:small subunit ribosomal protein S1